jgi:uncharacterized membrane protein
MKAAEQKDGTVSQFCIALLVITGVAALLRFFRLGADSLWWDELLTLSTVQVTGSGFIEEVIVRNSNTPFYFWLVQLSCRLFGESEWSLRLVSAVSGTLTIPLGTYFMRHMGGRHWRALLFGFMLAINPLLIWASQDARPYALLVCLGMAALWSWRIAVERNSVTAWALHGVLSLSCVFSHKIGLLFPVIAVFSSLTMGEARHVMKSMGVTTILLFVIVIPVFGFMSRYPTAYSIDRPMTGAEIPYTLYCYLVGYSFGPSVRELQQLGAMQALRAHWVQIVAGCFPLIFIAICSLKYVRRSCLPFLWMLIVPIAATVFMSYTSPYAYNVRYTLGALPGLFGIVCFAFPLGARWARVLVGYLVVIAIVSSSQWHSNPMYRNNDSREAVSILSKHLNVDARVVVAPAYTLALLKHYASRRDGDAWVLTGIPSGEHSDFSPVPDAFVLTREHHVPNSATLIQRFREACEGRVRELNCVGYRLWIRSDAPAGSVGP